MVLRVLRYQAGRLAGHRRPWRAAVLAMAAVILAASCSVGGGGGGFIVTADLTRANSLYPQSPVRALGIEIGKITKIENRGDIVRLTLEVNKDVEVPADTFARVVPLSVIGERYIQLDTYGGNGPRLTEGDHIPLERTSVPPELDELLSGLEEFLGAIEPGNVSSLVTNLADVLEDQGQRVNSLLQNGAGTVDILADKADEIGDIIGSLADLSSTLQNRTDSITELARNYNLVAELLVENRGDVEAVITNLNEGVVELTALIRRHQDTLPEDVATLAQTGRTLTRNLDLLDLTVDAVSELWAAGLRAYDPDLNTLDISVQATNLDYTVDLFAYRVRDRLSSVCRRLGLDALCGNPANAFFNGLVDLVPGVIDLITDGLPIGGPEASPSTPAAPPAGGGPPAQAQGGERPEGAEATTSDQALSELFNRMSSALGPEQQGRLSSFSPEQIAALMALPAEQLTQVTQLTPAEVDQLRSVAPADLAASITRLAAPNDPGAMLDRPLLPPSLSVDSLLGAIGGLVGGNR